MKKLIITSILALLVAAGTSVLAQNRQNMAQNRTDEYLGLPGDNLNLYAVMKLFQESETLEGFERNLNDENSRINNLDLNSDNMIDYIMVNDYIDGDVHNIVLSVALSQNEKQDVAVFTVQRFRDGSAQIQLIGDEALYGQNYIIEPIYDDNAGGTPNPGYTGRYRNRNNVTEIRTTTFQVASWPLIRFIYFPNYSIWHSSWYWGYYPTYWHPWHPYFWDYYYGYHYNYYSDYYRHYRHWQHPRYERYNDFYYSGIRAHSSQVNDRIKEGHYKDTYSHPEQRREGEALYSKTNPGQNTRRSDNATINNQERRSGSQLTRERSSAGTSRRSNTTVNDRSGANQPSGQNAGNNQRSTSTAPEKTVRNNSSDQRANVNRRSSVSVRESTVSRPEQSQKRETVRTSRQSAPRVSSPSRSSEKASKAGTAVKSSKKTKESETSKSSRRR